MPGWLALTLLIACSTALRAWGALDVPMPWIEVDETLYAKLGQSLYRHGSLELLGAPSGLYTVVYPALVGLPLGLGGLEHGYHALKVLQALVMSLAAVPVYCWTVTLASRRAALVAAALTLAVPGLAYSGLVMTEVAFYPLLVLAAWLSARALAQPTLQRQALAVGSILLACATRLQAVALPPALLGAAVLLALVERSRRPVTRLLPTWLAFAALGALWALWRLIRGVPLLGAYQAAAESSYGLEDGLLAIVRHAADLVLVTAVVPVAAVALLVTEVLRRREPSADVRAYAAVTTAFTVTTVVQVGLFASRHVGYIAERNVFSVAPLFFVGFAVWLERGAPRARLAAAITALLTVGLVLTIPIERTLSPRQLPFSFTAMALERLLGGKMLETQELVVFGAVAALGALFALVPRRLAWLLPLVVAVVLAGVSVVATRALADASRTQQTRFVGPVKDWVDRAHAGPSFYLYDGDRDVDGVWANLFWNDDIRRVYDLAGTSVIGPLPQREVTLWPDGTLRPAPAERAVVASSSFTFVGTRVAQAPQSIPGQTGLGLWKLEGRPRVSLRIHGFQPNGDVYAGTTGQAFLYGCAPGDLHVTVLVKQPQRLEIRRDGLTWRTLVFPKETVWDGRIPAPPGHHGKDVCSFELVPQGLIGTTVVEFEPGA